MKQIFTVFFTIILLTNANAQFPFGGKKSPSIKGNISGEIIDTTTNEAVGFASIALKKAASEQILNGVISGDNGKFKIGEVKTGKYDIVISFLGYEEKIIYNVETTLKDPDVNLEKIFLYPSSIILDAVEITEERALIENKVDKIVFNAEQDASIAGGDATEVLRKVPMLSVDLDGNVSLRGSQNVKILINGKPSGMFSSNTADALKMFPADQIKKVEVITSPGAKYDGEGGAGIINIITKKANIEGVAGSINLAAGNRQSNGNINLNIGRGRFGFTTNGGVFYSLPQDGTRTFLRTSLSSGEVLYSSSGVTETSRLGFNGSANAFYDFNAFNAINSTFTLRGFGFDTEGEGGGEFFNQAFTNSTIGESLRSGYDWNTDYTKKYEGNEKKELVFAVQVSGNIQDTENEIFETGLNARDELVINNADNLELTGQIDYVQPVGNSNKLEMGVKSVIRNIDSESDYSVNTLNSNLFLYDQNVYAGYMSYNFFFNKLNIVTGLRYERTDIKGDGDTEAQLFKNNYDNFLPNIAISKTLKGFRTLKISYSKRIQRPSLFYINPFFNNTDVRNVSQGNPNLEPELTDQFELGYNTNFIGFSIFGSLYYKHNKSLIETINVQDDSTIGGNINTYENVGQNKSVGINIFTSKSVGRLTVRGGGDIYSYNADGIIEGQEISNSALSYRIFTGGDFSLTGTIKADFFGFFQAPRFTLQGENASFSIFGIGFRKDFKNSSIGIRIIEPFNEFKSFDSDITNEQADFRQVTSFKLPFRSVGISFRYKFGKVDFKERKSKIKNSDLKQGEGGNGQQEGGQTGGRNSG